MAEPATLTPTQLHCLADWLPVLEAPDFNAGQWRGGDADANGVLTVPWFEYSRSLGAWPGPCAESLIVMGFDWMTWLRTPDGAALANDLGTIERATSSDLARLVTAIRRGDRFVEGNIVGAFESGVLTAISRRAAALLDRAE